MFLISSLASAQKKIIVRGEYFVTEDLILRSGRGKYKLNPKCYFKGANTDRLKILNYSVEYQVGKNDLFDDRSEVS